MGILVWNGQGYGTDVGLVGSGDIGEDKVDEEVASPVARAVLARHKVTVVPVHNMR